MLSILLGVLLGVLIYHYGFKPMKYWEEKGVISAPTWPVIGAMYELLFRKLHMAEFVTHLYNKYPNHRYVGYMQFTVPLLLIRDLDLIKQITVKDFDYFHDHMMSTLKNDNDPLMSKSLINLTGDKWKRMRSTLSPAFTSSKMRSMYSLISECAENFATHYKGKERVAVEMKDLLSRFTTDVIATTAFGIEVNSVKEPKNQFFTMSKRLTRFTSATYFLVKILLITIFPFIAQKFDVRVFPRDVTDFFNKTVMDNIKKREAEGIVRKDMIQLLMEARRGEWTHESVEEKAEGFATVEESHIGKSGERVDLTDDHIVSQAMLFFLAGFESVSTASCFLAHELAVNSHVQRKLQQEIDCVNAQHHGKIPYETLLSMKYLDQVVCESLRMWPPAFQLDRLCVRDYVIPPKTSEEREVVIKKGTSISIPTTAIHRDPQYYPDPDRFDPERFSEENKGKISPWAYMPFGLGPRNCIGSRFALLEVKTLFFHLLSKFDIEAINDTEIPLKISPKMITLSPENGFRLALKPRHIPSC